MTLAHLASIERPTIREHAEARLRDAIIEGRLAPGERLVERELCEALGISRPSLREALRGLACEGLVQIVAHRGPAVAVITREQAAEIFAVREALEGMAARLLAARRDPDAIARMRQSVRTLQRMAAGRLERAELVATEAVFYDALLRGCGNPTLALVMRQLLARISLLRRTSFSRSGSAGAQHRRDRRHRRCHRRGRRSRRRTGRPAACAACVRGRARTARCRTRSPAL
jgi:DNA-binding GntR family transcriptional regulator